MGGASKRYKLSKKETRRLQQELSRLYPRFTLSRKADIEYAKISGFEFYIIDGIPAFFRKREILLPVLIFLIKRGAEWLPRVVVDRGATRAVGKGADLMVPGIRDLDEFEEGDIVVVIDEETRVPIAVGEALMSSRQIREKLSGERRGRAVKNLHYPGDDVWDAAKNL